MFPNEMWRQVEEIDVDDGRDKLTCKNNENRNRLSSKSTLICDYHNFYKINHIKIQNPQAALQQTIDYAMQATKPHFYNLFTILKQISSFDSSSKNNIKKYLVQLQQILLKSLQCENIQIQQQFDGIYQQSPDNSEIQIIQNANSVFCYLSQQNLKQHKKQQEKQPQLGLLVKNGTEGFGYIQNSTQLAGIGMLITQDNIFYLGNFEYSQLEGYGICIDNSFVMKGTFKTGLITQGERKCGYSKQIGDFKYGTCLTGAGKVEFCNGKVMEGKFMYDSMMKGNLDQNGSGNGEIYVHLSKQQQIVRQLGLFTDWQLNGAGVSIIDDEKIQGNFVYGDLVFGKIDNLGTGDGALIQDMFTNLKIGNIDSQYLTQGLVLQDKMLQIGQFNYQELLKGRMINWDGVAISGNACYFGIKYRGVDETKPMSIYDFDGNIYIGTLKKFNILNGSKYCLTGERTSCEFSFSNNGNGKIKKQSGIVSKNYIERDSVVVQSNQVLRNSRYNSKILFSNDDVYYGPTLEYKANGVGVTFSNAGSKYLNLFSVGQKIDIGIEYIDDGSTIQRQYKNGKLCGEAKMLDSNNNCTRVEKYFEDQLFEGAIDENGSGFGTIYRKDGTTCMGQLMTGLMCGNGKALLKNGEIIEGFFHNDMVGVGCIDQQGCGEGKIICLDGTVKEGTIVSWRVKKGKITYSNNQMFEGSFVNEMLIKGKIVFPNGHIEEIDVDNPQRYL